MSPTPVRRLVSRIASRVRFPYLLLLTATLFAVDLLVPDLIPFVDEILLGLATGILATWRRRGKERPSLPRGS
jgi:hypothetical protein